MSAYARQSDTLSNALAAIAGAVLIAFPFVVYLLRTA